MIAAPGQGFMRKPHAEGYSGETGAAPASGKVRAASVKCQRTDVTLIR
jgi:hypothetical protein